LSYKSYKTRELKRFASIDYTCNSRCSARMHFRNLLKIGREKREEQATLFNRRKASGRKITPSRVSRMILAGGKRTSARLSRADRRTRQIRKPRSRRSEWRLRRPLGYRSLRHMASLDSRERVSLSSLGRSSTHTRSHRRCVGIILHVTRTSPVTPRLTIFKDARPITTGENRLRTRCRSASVLS